MNRILRRFGTSRNSSWELHGFSDTSKLIISAKSKVALVKLDSREKLELYGALLLVRLSSSVLENSNSKPSEIHFLTDSKVH